MYMVAASQLLRCRLACAGRSWSPRGAARELSGFPCHRKLRRAQITIRGIFLDANPFITSYASATNKYHTGYYSNYVRAPTLNYAPNLILILN